jgi:hypothetical protein
LGCSSDGFATGPTHYEQLQEVTKMLCGLCREVEKLCVESHLTPTTTMGHVSGLNLWWQKHQEIDALRLGRERAEALRTKLKAEARAKLSREELEALGL